MRWKKERYETWQRYFDRWKIREWSGRALHRLRDIIIIAICGAEGWVDVEEFGKAKEAWLTELLQLPNGIPSHDTFGRVFAQLDPGQFEASFVQWVQGISTTVQGVIASASKTLCRSHEKATGKQALHLVSAWAVENRLVLAQLATAEKSKEITAIPVLLRQLALAGCIVTIDAMGTQTKCRADHRARRGVCPGTQRESGDAVRRSQSDLCVGAARWFCRTAMGDDAQRGEGSWSARNLGVLDDQ